MANTATIEGKHPRGLYVLFFTEMWERFGYYLMIGIFFLYLTDTVGHGGRGLDNVAAISIVGTYVALIYLTPFIGGLVADRILFLLRMSPKQPYVLARDIAFQNHNIPCTNPG